MTVEHFPDNWHVLRTDSFFLAWNPNEKAVLDIVIELIEKWKESTKKEK